MSEDPGAKLEPFEALIGEWTMELRHVLLPDTLVHGRTSYAWLEGGRFLIQRSVVDHPDFPDSICVIGVMEGESELSMQSFDSRGIHRTIEISFDGTEMRTKRDAPGFDQRGTATLAEDGRTLTGISQLNRDGEGFRDDLAYTYRRVEGGATASRP